MKLLLNIFSVACYSVLPSISVESGNVVSILCSAVLQYLFLLVINWWVFCNRVMPFRCIHYSLYTVLAGIYMHTSFSAFTLLACFSVIAVSVIKSQASLLIMPLEIVRARICYIANAIPPFNGLTLFGWREGHLASVPIAFLRRHAAFCT